MPDLYLLRHAKSAWPVGVPDIDRPLGPRGRRDAPVAGALLARLNALDLVCVSPAMRTRQTWQLASQQLSYQPEVRFDDRIYAADLGDLIAVLLDVPETVQRLLLVGHNPGMEELALFLARPVPTPDYEEMSWKYPTSGLAHLRADGSWRKHTVRRGQCELVSFRIPRGVKET